MNINIILEKTENGILFYSAYDEKLGELGFMQVLVSPECYYIENIYVYEQYRRKGVASELVNYFSDNIPLEVLLPVYIRYVSEDVDEAFDKFIKSGSFLCADSGVSYEALLSEAVKNEMIEKVKISPDISGQIHFLKELPDAKLRELVTTMKSKELFSYDNVGDLKENADFEISGVVINKDKIRAGVVFSRDKDLNLAVEIMFTDDDSKILLFKMFVNGLRKTYEQCADAKIYINCVNERSKTITEQLFKNVDNVMVRHSKTALLL